MPSEEWYYDASTSRLLRFIAHLPVAALGGAFLLIVGSAAALVVTNPQLLRTPPVLLIALLVLVGGPFSILYLWPMLTDSDQHPSATEFEGAEGFPFTARSVGGAALVGAVGILAAVLSGVPFDVIYWVAVTFVFSPLLVAVVTTHGALREDELLVNRTAVPLARIRRVRSIRIGAFEVFWLSYMPRSGVFLPRLFTVPTDAAEDVRTTLETGSRASPEIEPPDRTVQVVLFASGVLTLAVAALASVQLTDAVPRRYVVGGFGGIGVVLCLLGWRGL